MKILMTAYSIQDWGGIINHVEHLAAGLKECGHEVEFALLVPQQKVSLREAGVTGPEWRTLGTGYHYSQQKGWRGVKKIPYLGDFNVKQFKNYANGFDAIFWHIPVPTLASANAGISDWLKLYSHGRPNFAIIHDGNLVKLYPHISAVQDHFRALICVHESAFESAKHIGLPRVLIPNPFDVRGAPPTTGDWLQRNGFVAAQVFKAWKRMETLIRAIPHMANGEHKIIGGGGIEQRYMTSPEKCKPNYYDSCGNRIWDTALKAGMSYHGFIPNDTVLAMLRGAKLQIDPSWSLKYSEFGAHFNRTTIEAMICGALPIATDLGMANSAFFKAGSHYVELSHKASPEQFAALVDNCLNNRDLYERITQNNFKGLIKFDRTTVAQEYIDLVTVIPPMPTYQTSPRVIQASNKNLGFFKV